MSDARTVRRDAIDRNRPGTWILKQFGLATHLCLAA